MEAVFIYKYDCNSTDLFAVADLMNGYNYELANLRDIEDGVKWGEIIILSEGVYFYNDVTNTYMKIDYLVKELKNNCESIVDWNVEGFNK